MFRVVSFVLLSFIFNLCAMFAIVACGVRGDPMPPEKPPLLGKGVPVIQLEQNKIKKNIINNSNVGSSKKTIYQVIEED